MDATSMLSPMAKPSHHRGPIALFQVRPLTVLIAMALSKRLQQMQQEPELTKMDFTHLSMSELEASKLDFGQKHVGKTYAQVWTEDQPWVTWVVQHYEKSLKPAHQKFMYLYVTAKVERAELMGEKIPVKAQAEATKNPPRTLMMPKAKARPHVQQDHQEMPTMHSWEEEIDTCDGTRFEMISEGTMPPYQPPQEEPVPTALEMRVINMENALARVMEFLEQRHATREDLN
jgi:hypothetical protein